MIAVELCNSKDEEIQKDFYKARRLLHKINPLSIEKKGERDEAIFKLFKNTDESSYIAPPFYCDYGYNIIADKNLYLNFNCCILDGTTVTFGDNVMLAPNVQIYTTTHP